MTFSLRGRSIHLAFILAAGGLPACVFDYQVGNNPLNTDGGATGEPGSSTDVSSSGGVATAGSDPTGSEATGSEATGSDPTESGATGGMPGVMLGTCEFVDQPPDARCGDDSLQPGDFCFGGATSLELPPTQVVLSMLTLSLDGDGAADFLMSDEQAVFGILNRPGELQYKTIAWPRELLPPGYLTLVDRGDLDGDGVEDVLLKAWPEDADSSVHVVFIDEQGSIASTVLVADGAGAQRILDWDGDGDLDVLIVRDTIQVALGDGAGGLAEPSPTKLGNHAEIAFGALDADGAHDDALLGVGSGLPGVLHVVGGEVEAFTFAMPEGLYLWQHAITDLDHDGLGDIVVLAHQLELPDPDVPAFAVEVVVGLQATGFAPTRYPVACDGMNMAIGDLDGDGSPDIAVLGEDRLTARRNDGAGGFLQAINLPVVLKTDQLVIADVSGDGAGDIVSVHAYEPGIFINDL